MMKWEFVYIVYDIKDDTTRTYLIRQLIYFGLHRIQYSVFNGLISLEDKKQLLDEINNIEIGAEDKICVIELCDRCKKNVIEIGKKTEVKEHVIL